MTVPPVPGSPKPIDAAVAAFRRHLHLPDPGPVYVTLATVIANRRPGDPVWTLLVGPPGCGKTEVLGPLASLPDVHAAATLTEASLLSGVPKKDVAAGSKGGLLRDIGDYGIVALKDFTSVLSMHRDARSSVLAALREIYDGSWTRHLGTDGGRRLHWEGKVGIVAGCTPTIDRHHAVMGSMGERFVLYRMPAIDEHEQVMRALERSDERAMRNDLAAAVAAALDAVDLTSEPDRPDTDRDRLISLASLATRCRSAVERDGYSREIELVPGSEAPARLALVLRRLLDALTLLGVDHATAWNLATHIGLGSMAAIRKVLLEQLAAADGPQATKPLAVHIGYPTNTAKRALEDLAAHRVVTRHASAGGNQGDRWELSDWTRRQWQAVCEPEMSDDLCSEPEMSDDLSSLISPSAQKKTFRVSKVDGNGNGDSTDPDDELFPEFEEGWIG